jgi:predicted HicB family RNase H-like nuclease
MRTYTKSENTAELHVRIDPQVLYDLKKEALERKISLGKLVRERLAK